MTAMNIKESLAPNVAGNVIFPDFAARVKRIGIVGISGIVSNPEAIRELEQSNIIEFPKKENTYHPRRRVEKVVDHQSNLVRLRRKSRCDGVHDAEEKPCGSPRCRTKGRQKLRVASDRPNRKSARQPDPLKVNRNFFKRTA